MPIWKVQAVIQATFEVSKLTVISQIVVYCGGPDGLPTAAAGGCMQNCYNYGNDSEDSLTMVIVHQLATEFKSVCRDTRW